MSNTSVFTKRLFVLLLTFLLAPISLGVSAGESGTEKRIRALFDKADAAVASEDLDKLVTLIHPDAPNAEKTRQRFAQILEDRELEEEVIGFHFLAEDLPYAFARAQVKWTGKGKEPFRDNITDTLYIFKKDGTEWKLWGEVPLGVMLLDKSS